MGTKYPYHKEKPNKGTIKVKLGQGKNKASQDNKA